MFLLLHLMLIIIINTKFTAILDIIIEALHVLIFSTEKIGTQNKCR